MRLMPLAQVRGAVDDLDRVLAILAKTGYAEDRFYIHCDGALFGLMARPPPLAPGCASFGPCICRTALVHARSCVWRSLSLQVGRMSVPRCIACSPVHSRSPHFSQQFAACRVCGGSVCC